MSRLLRVAGTLVAVVVLAGVAGFAFNQATGVEEDAVTVGQLRRDLNVEATLSVPKVVQIGRPVRIAAELVNRSETVTHRVVAPGDGSESGWREPHVHYSGERRADDGSWKPLERRGIGRCGNYDSEWHDEVRKLAPGDRLSLSDWFVPPGQVFDLTSAGSYRFRVHYVYSAGKRAKGSGSLLGEDVGPMKGVPAFELISDPVELRIVRGLELEVAVLEPIRRGAKMKLADLLDARIVNRGETKRDVVRSDWRADLFAEPYDAIDPYQDPQLTFIRAPDPTPLAPGESLPLFGIAFDPEVSTKHAASFRLHVTLRSRGEDGTVLVASPVAVSVSD